MSIQNDKLMNLADGKVLYDDLRERVEGKPDIDDTAGDGDTNKVWSANKSYDELTEIKGTLNDIEGELADKYEKPSGGIPASDIASGVIPSVPVQDVQIDSTSILSNGIAGIPVASSSTPGVVKTNTGLGTMIASKQIATYPALDSDVKTGTHNNRPIVPSNQHRSVFYGLAKAAGADEKDSSLSFGTYSDNAKAAIQSMLGIHNIEVVRLA